MAYAVGRFFIKTLDIACMQQYNASRRWLDINFYGFMEAITNEFSYRKIARLTGLSPSTIMRIRKHEVEPDFKTVELIANTFGCDIIIRGYKYEANSAQYVPKHKE